ncbi:hypothetical protein FKW77_008908 [Venturia effusa]|uniref:Uncharacterized protein n=1 Tax=Venturia effusa TaxID=50376 RepID=A0A517LEG8_9PEZI|nr:hypothetical protein FKW77_008908 [Venturia effusa]
MDQPDQPLQVVFVPVPYPVYIQVPTPPPPPPEPPIQPQNPQALDGSPDLGPTPNLFRPIIFPNRRWIAGRRCCETFQRAMGGFREALRRENWRRPCEIPDAPRWSKEWWKFQTLKWTTRTCNGWKQWNYWCNEHQLIIFYVAQIKDLGIFGQAWRLGVGFFYGRVTVVKLPEGHSNAGKWS